MRDFPIETPPLRALFVIPGEAGGSSMIFARRQAESLAQEGVEVDSFYLRSRTSPLALAREFHRLRGRIEAFRPALIHAHFGTVTAAFSAVAAGRLPLVITYRGGDLNRRPPGLRVCTGHLLSQLAALRATRIVCVSRGLRERLWWRRGRAVILPTGFDSGWFRPEPGHVARASLGWPADQPVVLFNAGHDPRTKRLDLARKAVAVARQMHPDPQRPDLRLEILRGDIPPQLIPSYMNASDCLLIASDSEGSPAVLQEALACALPVVSVDVGDAAERLRGVAPSRLVSRDPQVIGRALAEITATPRRSNGPQSVQFLSLRRTALDLCRLYRETLGMAGAHPNADAAAGEPC
jgi:teichuronic acid biosynthesis glycosyltransferase TuaC